MSVAASGAGGSAIVRAGHLRKLKTMKKKYFVVRGDTPECSARLEYYESEKKFKAGATPRRVIPLKSCYNITRRLDLKQKHVIALFTREEQFCIVAENEQDLHGWLAAILKLHRTDDASDELLLPIQHVWQVNVQKKGLGATKNIQGFYNLCLTDKTLTLVKIKSHNNVISDLGIPERVEYSLKNIRRCGDSECFFYMEVGRQTVTGAGELWMHSDDANIAQSMHSTIYHAMRNCAKETENERDHIVIPKRSDSTEGSGLTARRSTYDGPKSLRAGLANDKILCVGSCIKQCVCATQSTDESNAAIAPMAPKHVENQPPNNKLTDQKETPARVIKHHRTISLPTGCPLFQEPLKIVHERTRSAPLTGDEVDRVVMEKAVTHSSCKAVNGLDVKKSQWSRRASTGTRLSKLSPAHSIKNATTLRSRCDSMPSRATGSFEMERPVATHADIDGLDTSRDEADSVEWHRTPRIPEEPDFCDSAIRELMSTSLRGSSIQHSRTSSIGIDDPPEAFPVPDGYLPMAPHGALIHEGGLVSASSGSVCSGTPSTDPRFSEYQLEPATSHIAEERPPRAYSVGSRPAPRSDAVRHRAYSVGARSRPIPPSRQPHAVSSAPLLPRASAEDLMELDFSNNSPSAKAIVSRTPPAASSWKRGGDEYVDMSWRQQQQGHQGYVEMRPGDLPAHPPATTASTTPDGYVEMSFSRPPRSPPRAASPPPDPDADMLDDCSLDLHHPLTTVREISEDGRRSPDLVRRSPELSSPEITRRPEVIPEDAGRKSPEVSSSPSYVKLVYNTSKPIATVNKSPEDEVPGNPLAMKALAREGIDRVSSEATSCATLVLAGPSCTAARFSLPDPVPTSPPPLNYASLDLEPTKGTAAPAHRTYTQIDFARSEKLAADGN